MNRQWKVKERQGRTRIRGVGVVQPGDDGNVVHSRPAVPLAVGGGIGGGLWILRRSHLHTRIIA